eukprot:TRINITY_DN24905_c0_g1_i1.p1 TRINITY_DN24905_c0_g1~~TRINITY_DN24905_c0_g1_i1.p1  ORF type:complete len:101 (+),score=17.22 TRINITY_DN24905_c0_g1_i1:184-486(+)
MEMAYVKQAFGNAIQHVEEVPECMLCKISWTIMLDPVITPSGISYDRKNILKHLEQQPNDPMTRKPLKESDLVPNIGLRECIEEFLDLNPWAYEIDDEVG